MQETGATDAAGASRQRVCEVRERNLVVEFLPGATDGLLLEALGGLGLLSRGRGVEAGGILLGWARREGDLRHIWIEGFRVLPCEHAQGPAYLLTDREKAEMHRLAATWARKPGRRHYLVGYWRSHTRGALSLRAEELDLLNELKAYGCEIAVLVEPRGAGPGVAALFLAEGEAFRAGEPAATCELGPVRPSRPRKQADSLSERVPAVEAPREPQARHESGAPSDSGAESQFRFSMFEPAVRAPRPRASKRLRWIAAIVLVLAAAAAAGAYALARGYVQLPSWQPPENPYALGLQVAGHGENLHLTWDRACRALELAERGVLVIADGDQLRVVELDQAHLRSGSVVYRPIGDRVSFRLELRWGQRSLSEAVEWGQAAPK